MNEIDETDIVGYKIKPGKETLNPIGKLTKHVCLNCVQPTDKKIREIKRRSKMYENTCCDRCFRYLQTAKKDDVIYPYVVRKDLTAFFRKKQTR